MRISDWSSDVCSSDLRFPDGALWSELADRNALDEEALQKLADALVDFHSRAQIAWPGDGAVRIGKIIAGNAEAMALYPDILDPMAVEDLNGRLEAQVDQRSEESRVGKECGSKCRSRWSPYH